MLVDSHANDKGLSSRLRAIIPATYRLTSHLCIHPAHKKLSDDMTVMTLFVDNRALYLCISIGVKFPFYLLILAGIVPQEDKQKIQTNKQIECLHGYCDSAIRAQWYAAQCGPITIFFWGGGGGVIFLFSFLGLYHELWNR